MTACVNKKKSGVVSKVVTASLVGALTLGGVSLAAVPTVAVAEQGADAQFAQGGVEGSEFVNGEIDPVFTKVSTDSAFKPGTDAHGVTTFDASSLPVSVSATRVKVAGTNAWENVTPGTNYRVAVYRADKDGKPTGAALSGNRVYEAGSYVLTVTALTDSDYEGQTVAKAFNVTGAQIKPDVIAENGDRHDTNFYFTGKNLNVSFFQDGKELVEGTDYKVSFYRFSDGKTVDGVKGTGTYGAKLTGLGKYAGTSYDTGAKIIVNDFELDGSTTIVVSPYTDGAPQHPDRVYNAATKTDLDPSLVNLTNPGGVGATTGKYTMDVSVDSSVNVNDNGEGVVYTAGSLKVPTYKVDAFGSFTYNGSELQDSYDIFPGQEFDPSAVKATFEGKVVTPNEDKVVAPSGKLDENSATGDHKVTFSYVHKLDNGKFVAASKTVNVHVWKGAIDADKGLYVFGPDSSKVAITSYAKGYDGNALTAGSFYVTNKDRTVTNAPDGDLVTTLYDEAGNKVDSATDAGTYTLKVTSEDYKLSGTTEIKVTIAKVDLTTAKVGKLQRWNEATESGEWILPLGSKSYTWNSSDGAVSALDLVWNTGNKADDPDSDPADDFKGFDQISGADVTVDYNDEGTWKPVARVDKDGDYRVTISVGDDVAKNYVLPQGKTSVTLEFKAAKGNNFSDVQPTDWYYKYVNEAAKQGFMNGDKDPMGGQTGNFRPESALTRAEAVTVLYNMSGQAGNENGGSNEGDFGYETGFDDVASSHWASKYIAWAKRSGVVKGYDGTNDFKADQTVTRNEFAQMLFNYAKNVAKDGTTGNVDTSVLKFSDGVDGWAQEAVAWAVSTPSKFEGETDSKVISGYPADNTFKGGNNVLRAEVAKMAVSYQKKALR